MVIDPEASGARIEALLKEAVITAAQKRSACVTLADRALIATGWDEDGEAAGTWDEDGAKAMTRVALEAIGELPCERAVPAKPPRGCAQTVVNYERPGRST